MGKWRNALSAVALTFFLSSALNADRIVLQNGKTFDGEITSEDDQSVTIEVWGVESSFTRRIGKSQIKSWDKPSHDGQPYVVIPVFGVIGEDVTVDALRAGLAQARVAQPKYVILAIDSPGGEISQMIGMIDLLNDASKTLKIVAYVKSAYSAAAVIAMSCPEVFMKPDATIGATVPFRMTENGPADVDAKFRSVIEARMRAANEHGGHADLLIRGMSELDLEIYLGDDSGKPMLRTSGPGKLIKSKGQILALTADEAVEYGFARIAPTMTDLGTQVCGGPWYEANRRAYNATIGTVAIARRREQQALRQRQLQIAKQNAIAQIKPQWDSIEGRIAELVAKAVADDNVIADLTAKCNQEIQLINLDYQQAVINAKYQTDPNAAVAHALEVANGRASAARQYLQANVAQLQADGQAAQVEIHLLRDKQKQLFASIPSE